MQTLAQTTLQLLNLLALLQTKQTLENYKEFCYNLYLLATYNHQRRPHTQTYPNGYRVTNHYKNGILDQVIGSDGKVHYSINQMNAFGDIADATFASGVKIVLVCSNEYSMYPRFSEI